MEVARGAQARPILGPLRPVGIPEPIFALNLALSSKGPSATAPKIREQIQIIERNSRATGDDRAHGNLTGTPYAAMRQKEIVKQ
jgi:hypothetical protein